MPDFTASARVYLEPGAEKVPVSCAFVACTTAAANDGSLPYGTTIASATVEVLDTTGDAVADILDAGSVAVSGGGLLVSFTLSYPTTSPAGLYAWRVLATLSTGAKVAFEGQRIVVGKRF